MNRTAKVTAIIPGEDSAGTFNGEVRTAGRTLAQFDDAHVPFEIDVDASEFMVVCERTDEGGDVQLEVEVRSEIGPRLWGRSRGRQARILVAAGGIRCV
ncbi:MAG: hypothetical protein ACREL7_15395 [Longimicrobiales bacterium]